MRLHNFPNVRIRAERWIQGLCGALYVCMYVCMYVCVCVCVCVCEDAPKSCVLAHQVCVCVVSGVTSGRACKRASCHTAPPLSVLPHKDFTH